MSLMYKFVNKIGLGDDVAYIPIFVLSPIY